MNQLVERRGTAPREERRLSWVCVGEGPTLVLLPGIGSGRRLFGTLPRRFARRGFQVITYDPVGIPPSSDPRTDGFSFDHAAADVWAVVDDVQVAGPVHLVGVSLGGKVGLTMAAGTPERVRSLTMLASSAVVTARARRVYRFFERVAGELPAEHFADATLPFLFGRSFHARHPAVVDDIARATKPPAPTRRLMVAQARELQRFDGEPLARSLTCPTLCAAGAEDTLTGLDEVRLTAELIPGSRYVEFERAGHSLMLEDPAVYDALEAFVREPA